MVKVRKSLTSLDEFLHAIRGYEHLDTNLLLQFLIEHYTLDLDLVPDFIAALSHSAAHTVTTTEASARVAA